MLQFNSASFKARFDTSTVKRGRFKTIARMLSQESNAVKISIDKARSISEILFAHLAEYGIDEVELPNDYYWHVPEEELYDPYQMPSSLTLGVLSSNWEDLNRLTDNSTEPLAYDLIRLATILRAIGERVPI